MSLEGGVLVDTYLASLVLFYQNLIDTKRARACRQSQNKWMGGRGVKVLDPLDDVVGNVGTSLLVVVTDDEPHLD